MPKMQSSFSVGVTHYQKNTMLNMCDAILLGKHLKEQDGPLNIHISPEYYGGDIINKEKAAQMLRSAHVINIVGENSVNLAIHLGLGSRGGARIISGVPFLLVFQM